MTHVRTLILGGGMSGLSCAYHLNKAGNHDYVLLERSDEPGGLSRSIKQDGFVFDHTGHLLHLHKPYTQKLIPDLLADNIVSNERRAWIYSHKIYTHYPYQANLHGLPQPVIDECLKGMEGAQIMGHRSTDGLDPNGVKRPQTPQTPVITDRRTPQSFENWVLHTFGSGFGKHFFFPYNEKLWQVSIKDLTDEWVAPFVPLPSIREIKEGALTDQTKKYGYNTTFYYPREGGIQSLAFAFAKNLPHIRLNTSVVALSLKKKEATLSTGETISYGSLVNSVPLVRFLQMAKELPSEIISGQKLLRCSSVCDINLGVKRPDISNDKKHWIYFPEREYNFYRVGFPMNFSDRTTPPGCSSMYVEIGYKQNKPFDEANAVKEAIRGLLKCGLLRDESEIMTRNILHIPFAYVTYDRNRTRIVDGDKGILSWLRSQNVYSIGRFGAWKYSYMEEAILEGQATAEKILGQQA
jgi:protoporphyrinogen oxidase